MATAVWHNLNKLKCPIEGCEAKSNGSTRWFCETDGSDVSVCQNGFIKCSKAGTNNKPAHQGAMCFWKWKCRANGEHPYSNDRTIDNQRFLLSLSHAVQFMSLAGAEWSATLCNSINQQSEDAGLQTTEDEEYDNVSLHSQLRMFTFETKPSVKCYKMTTKPKGIVLIVNNVNFDTSGQRRDGAEHDDPRLRTAFKNIGFEVREVKDLGAEEMLKTLKDFSKLNDHRNYDSLGVVIMTHGDENIICGIDNENLNVYDLIILFNSKNCPAMANKPKLIVFNACRGDEQDHNLNPTGITSMEKDSAFVSSPHKTFESFKVQPANSDFVIAYSTFPGYTSFRNRIFGSYFIQHFADLIESLHDKQHLLDILTVVGREVAEKTKEKIDHHQSPIVSSTLRAKWYLTPPNDNDLKDFWL